jgi:hypothetical protein
MDGRANTEKGEQHRSSPRLRASTARFNRNHRKIDAGTGKRTGIAQA